MTQHPEQGKQGVNIDQGKYELLREEILAVIGTYGEITFTELVEVVSERLAGKFDGSISWYVTTVKLDLEARGLIERIPGQKPQKLRLSTSKRNVKASNQCPRVARFRSCQGSRLVQPLYQ